MTLLGETGPATPTELAAELPVSRQAVAKHLGSLAGAGLVQQLALGPRGALPAHAGAAVGRGGVDGRRGRPVGHAPGGAGARAGEAVSRLDVDSVAACLALVAGPGAGAAPRPPAADPWPVWRDGWPRATSGSSRCAIPREFTWPGRFIALLDDGRTRRGVVMFGVPPGVLDDPAGGEGGTRGRGVRAGGARPVAGARGASPTGRPRRARGVVEAIAVAAAAEARARRWSTARERIAGRGSRATATPTARARSPAAPATAARSR